MGTGVSNWCYFDPICTLLFTILVLLTTKGTAIGILDSVMMRTPQGIELKEIRKQLKRVPNVQCIHDLHVWKVGDKQILTCHCVIKGPETLDVQTQSQIQKSNVQQHLSVDQIRQTSANDADPSCTSAEHFLTQVLKDCHTMLKAKFGIEHQTIQCEIEKDAVEDNMSSISNTSDNEGEFQKTKIGTSSSPKGYSHNHKTMCKFGGTHSTEHCCN